MILKQTVARERVRPQALAHRQRTELRNKLSPPTLVIGHGPSKTIGFPSFLGGILLHYHLATYGP